MRKKVSNTGQFWLSVDRPINLSVFSGLIELSAPIDIRSFRALIEKRLMQLTPFYQKIIQENTQQKKNFFWVDDQQFDIRTHVEMVRLKNENDPTELQQLMSNILSVPMDMNKPLWQFILVKKYQGGCAIIARIHQCLMDRVDLINVLWALSDSVSDTNHNTKPKDNSPPKWPFLSQAIQKIHSCVNVSISTAQSVLLTCLKPVTNPFLIIETIRVAMGTTTDRIGEIGRIILLNSDSDSLLKTELGAKKQYIWSRPFALKEIETLAKATNATLNIIFISTLAGAIKQYLKYRRSPIDYREIRAITPVDMRISPGGYSGNVRFGLIPFDLPVHIADPLQRIAEVKRRIQNLDNLPDAVSAFASLMRIGMSAETFVEKMAIPFSKKSSLLMTNTQGPGNTMYIHSIPVTNIMYWLPRIGFIGSGTTILSYNQNIRLGLVCDSKQIPDPKPFIDAFENQMSHLLKYSPNQTKNQVVASTSIKPELVETKIKPIAIDNVSGEMSMLG
ncbi:MAG: acyltransferase wes family protein [Candidatus Magnetoglobus multicellularis str. Araruama]|uniref:diacylglycerol O-acyltransferase n=1 Tax=Candidatus Magnetoglobus multicellularis str. Araruama TaxID=890399 RepID=A0A1V1PD02_9BACT|nr:MAG: acyltransferase wes family protein [Candidatus Magnetoglobus multicellularis str. Araruama]